MSMNENNQEGNNRSIDAARLTALFLAGAANLEAGKEWINELNVFPVPDGDTGTNMTLTIKSAVTEVENLDENSRSMRDVCKAISSGSLRGARGNSVSFCHSFFAVSARSCVISRRSLSP